MTLAAPLLRPRSVAVVGASDDESRTAGRPLAALRRSGFDGPVYPVSTTRRSVQGEPAWSSLADLPERPDHVLVVTPRGAVQGVVEDACALGVPLVSVVADGYGEAGEAGRGREDALRRVLAGSRTRLIGPSSLGVVSTIGRVALTANAVFSTYSPDAGGTFVASQSGSMIGALASRAARRAMGLAALVSVGSEMDLSLGEICEATLDEPGVDSYVLFLESIRHGAHIERFARRAAEAGRPVVAYVLGRSSQGAALAVTHTGALLGDHRVATEFLRASGVAVVDHLGSLLDAVHVSGVLPLRDVDREQRRVGVLTTTGGGAATLVDQLALRGHDVVPPSEHLRAALADAGVPPNSSAIVDLTLAGTVPHVVDRALTTMTTSGEFDLVAVVVGSSALTAPELAIEPLCAQRKEAAPFVTLVIPDAPGALVRLRDSGVPAFADPENCADAVVAVCRRSWPRAARPVVAHTGDGTTRLDEARSYGYLDRIGVARCPAETVRLPVSDLPDLPFAYPVALKVLSGDIVHKADVGGVVLGIADPAALRHAAAQVAADVTSAGHEASTVLVQPMVEGLAEVLLGYRVDAEAGPVVVLAAGGHLTELIRDEQVRLAPVDLRTARAMIDSMRMSGLLRGRGGRAATDLDALAAAVVAFSGLVALPEVVEAEVNPLLVGPAGKGVVAVDAVVVVSGDAR